MKIRLWIALLLFPFSAFSSALLEEPLPASLGVNIHFVSGNERQLDLIAAAGFKFARMDFLWTATEPAKGKFDWSAYDELTTNLEKRRIRPYYILDYSNPLYETNSMPPQHPESIQAYARWAAAAATHFKQQSVVWEIWNEPNGSFWPPRPNVAQYTMLALATCKAIRQADPGATIVAPACWSFDWPFLESFLKSGVLPYLSAVSVHPYRSRAPETVGPDYQRLKELIARDAPKGSKIPIVCGEWGYSSKTGGVPLQTQAGYLARQQLFNLYCGVPVSIWYDWSNDGTNSADRENNFGTVGCDLTPKPAYNAVQKLARELSGYSFAQRFAAANTNDFMLILTNAAGETRLAAWTVGKAHRVQFSPHRHFWLTQAPQYYAVPAELRPLTTTPNH